MKIETKGGTKISNYATTLGNAAISVCVGGGNACILTATEHGTG